MEKIRIQFTLFSAFYSPLISAMSGGFLKAEGLDPEWSVSPPGVSALAALKGGTAHVAQSALSQGFVALDKGETPGVVHFAQVNEMDGFFLTGRKADPAFSWRKLEGAELVTFKGGQPHAMFKYACHKAGIDYSKIKLITPGGPADIDKAFRDGQGQYVHQQGPFPQQLQADGIGHVVAQVGPVIGPCGFSSLAATPAWLQTGMAKAFMRAYRKTRVYMNEAPAAAGSAAPVCSSARRWSFRCKGDACTGRWAPPSCHRRPAHRPPEHLGEGARTGVAHIQRHAGHASPLLEKLECLEQPCLVVPAPEAEPRLLRKEPHDAPLAQPDGSAEFRD
ncbi:MAG: ABC transporter substrate-binding protein [Burkholderiales bacterium]